MSPASHSLVGWPFLVMSKVVSSRGCSTRTPFTKFEETTLFTCVRVKATSPSRRVIGNGSGVHKGDEAAGCILLGSVFGTTYATTGLPCVSYRRSVNVLPRRGKV